jgi:hypothetical protein
MTTEAWPSLGHNNPPEVVGQEESPEDFVIRRDKEIQAWLDSKPVLEAAKTAEMSARASVTSTLFPNPRKGTQRYALNGGFNVKLVHSLTYTIGDKDKVNDEGKKIGVDVQARELEEKICALGAEAELLCERLIKWKPELSATEYEKLDSESPLQLSIRNLVDEVLIVKPGSPQLTFEEPKAKS